MPSKHISYHCKRDLQLVVDKGSQWYHSEHTKISSYYIQQPMIVQINMAIGCYPRDCPCLVSFIRTMNTHLYSELYEEWLSSRCEWNLKYLFSCVNTYHLWCFTGVSSWSKTLYNIYTLPINDVVNSQVCLVITILITLASSLHNLSHFCRYVLSSLSPIIAVWQTRNYQASY